MRARMHGVASIPSVASIPGLAAIFSVIGMGVWQGRMGTDPVATGQVRTMQRFSKDSHEH